MNMVGGIPTPLQNSSWDDDIPNSMEESKNVPNHQAVMILVFAIVLLPLLSFAVIAIVSS